MDSFQSIYNSVRRITRPIILRKLELLFYFLFIPLGFIGFILPFVVDVNKAASYSVGVLSIIYAIGFHFLRLKIVVTFGLVIHTVAFLLFSSFIILDFGMYEIGGVLIIIAVVCLSIIVILCGLGHRVFANGVNEPPVNQAWPEVEYQADVNDGQDDINLNHWRFNNDAHSPEMPNDVNPEIMNVADPEIQGNDIDPGMQINDVAYPQMQENDDINPEIQDFADPQMQENDDINPEIQDVTDPQMQENHDINPEMQNDDVAAPQTKRNENINLEVQKD